jgi:autotransporter-associated beta strand protein
MIVRGTPMDRKIGSQIKRFAAAVTIMAGACTLEAGSATWNLNPVNNHWSKAANWTPQTVPYGENDVATFAISNVTEITLEDTPDGYADNVVSEISFAEGASAYTITLSPVTRNGYRIQLVLVGAGITNNSGLVQNFVASRSTQTNSGEIFFQGFASAGENVVITNEGGDNTLGGIYGSFTAFWDNSTAAKATIINEGSTVSGTIYGGFTNLVDYSSAESATLINNAGTVSGAAAGHTFVGTSPPGNIGTSTFINNAAAVPGAEGGWTEIDGGVSDGATFLAKGATVADAQGGQVYAFGGDGYSTYTAEGGNGTNAQGGLIDVLYVPASAQTVVTAEGGTNGGLGGTILIEDSADIPLPQFQVFGNGVLDLTNVSDQTMSIGSLAGDGIVLLAGHDLNVGNNNLSTTFSGVIQDSGTLSKAGTGTLTLTGANIYTGTTTVGAGTLVANNTNGSATGTGAVNVSAGALGGKGIIQGAVTIGTGSGSGAFLAPSVSSNQPRRLTLKKTLAFKADGTYTCKLNTNNSRADQIVAKGVTIQSGAQFDFQPVANKRLTLGTVFSAINNTSASPITGTFANLPDGSTFAAGRNNYQVSYEGGDSNDLTLTVVP